jgi:hypothetical protein
MIAIALVMALAAATAAAAAMGGGSKDHFSVWVASSTAHGDEHENTSERAKRARVKKARDLFCVCMGEGDIEESICLGERPAD